MHLDAPTEPNRNRPSILPTILSLSLVAKSAKLLFPTDQLAGNRWARTQNEGFATRTCRNGDQDYAALHDWCVTVI